MDKVSGKTTNITPQSQSSTQSTVSSSGKQNKNTMNFKDNSHAKASTGRLNALDSTLLEDNAYRDIDDLDFKIEYKIEKLESELESIRQELEVAKSLNDTQKFDILTMHKRGIEKQLEELYATYNGGSITGRLTNSIVKPHRNYVEKIFENVYEFVSANILSKVSNRFKSKRNLNIAVNQLVSINKNVDELITLQAPYGEKEEKYDQLSKYITKANTIQYNVSKELNKKKTKNPFAELTSREKAIEKAKKLLQINKKKDIAQKNALNMNNNLKG